MTREEAIKWLYNLTIDIGEMRHKDLWVYAQAITEIGQMIADIPDIVRCKDCKYCKKAEEKYEGDRFEPTDIACTVYDIYTHPNDFCSYGVKKESKIKKCFGHRESGPC